MMDTLIEVLASQEHDRWSGWMVYLFTKGKFNIDGSFTIEPDSTRHWLNETRKMYWALSEDQKESDRKEVRKILAVLGNWFDALGEGNPELMEGK